MPTRFSPSRRSLIQGGVAAAAIPFTGALRAFAEQLGSGAGAVPPSVGPYGRVRPVKDRSTGLELLQLPEGFDYASLSWTGDAMANGDPVPPRHDGMAVVTSRRRGGVLERVLVRNHEVGSGEPIRAPGVYDAIRSPSTLGGGTTNLVVGPDPAQGVETLPSLGGTLINCAGGPTPWGTWLTCEETTVDLRSVGGKKHGYVFEVGPEPDASAGVPIVGMGRFVHEAVAVDPGTGIVYLTQDDLNKSALYRYIPDDDSGRPGSLGRGGRLQAARVKGLEGASLLSPALGEEHDVEWVDVSEPDADPRDASIPDAPGPAAGPFLEAWAAGALRLSRGEGIWYFGGRLFVVDTSAGTDEEGRAGFGGGAVWELELARMRLRAIFVCSDPVAGNHPDNVTVSPRGGILVCEDGGGVDDAFGFGNRLMGLLPSGDSFIFAKNNIALRSRDVATAGKSVPPEDYRGAEFCGACFDHDGSTLFVNVQSPGITFAISGPWARGPL